MFSRLVELNRLRLMTRQEEDEQGRQDPDRVVRLPSENKGGVREVYIKVNTRLKSKVFSLEILILLIWRNVPRTNVAWTNVVVTVVLYC